MSCGKSSLVKQGRDVPNLITHSTHTPRDAGGEGSEGTTASIQLCVVQTSSHLLSQGIYSWKTLPKHERSLGNTGLVSMASMVQLSQITLGAVNNPLGTQKSYAMHGQDMK